LDQAPRWPVTIDALCAVDAHRPRLIAAGRLELAGDAARAPSPTSGQGASMAAEDGVVLARVPARPARHPAGAGGLRALRRRRVERIVAQGARTGSAKTPGPSAACCATCCCRWCSAFLVTDRSLAWIYDHHLDWDAPATAETRAG